MNKMEKYTLTGDIFEGLKYNKSKLEMAEEIALERIDKNFMKRVKRAERFDNISEGVRLSAAFICFTAPLLLSLWVVSTYIFKWSFEDVIDQIHFLMLLLIGIIVAIILAFEISSGILNPSNKAVYKNKATVLLTENKQVIRNLMSRFNDINGVIEYIMGNKIESVEIVVDYGNYEKIIEVKTGEHSYNTIYLDMTDCEVVYENGKYTLNWDGLNKEVEELLEEIYVEPCELA